MLRTIAWIIVVLAVAEVGLEARAHRRGYATILFGPAAVAGETGDDGGATAARDATYGPTGAFPFRSRILAPERTDGITRYWLASASYGEDIYVAAPLIFPNLLADRLDVELVNDSRAGYAIAGNTQRLRELGATWRPDVVVLYQMSVDIERLTRQLLQGDGASDPQPAGAGGKKQPGPVVRLYESTTLYANLREALGGRLAQQRLLADDLGPEATRRFRVGLDDFVAACREIGAEPVLCTFAAAYDEANHAAMPARMRVVLFRSGSELSVRGWTRTIAALNDVIRAAARDHALRLVDTAREFHGRPEYFRDFIHFGRRGHEAMAGFLAAALDSTAAAREVVERPAP